MHIASIFKDQKEGKEYEIKGWVYRIRKMKDKIFAIMRDSEGYVQIVFSSETKAFTEAEKLKMESSFMVKGKSKKDDKAPGGFEIVADEIKIYDIGEDFPIQKDYSIEFLADVRHLWLRSKKMTAIMKVRSTIFSAIREYFAKEGFYEFHSPIFQSTQCEGGSELFAVKYFDKELFLTQTWQLPAETAIYSLEKIYTIAPTFRAEKSLTSRHLTEFWMAEMEIAWAKFEDIQDYGEGLIKHILKRVLAENRAELEILERDISKLMPALEKPFTRMTYDDALKILKEKAGMDIEWGKDLRTVEEEKLTTFYDTPLIVTRYPKAVKAFYMKEDPKNPMVVLGCDFLAPEGFGEIIGGSEREEKIESIKERLRAQGEDPKNYEMYLDTRRYGSIPHGGFGMGVERIVRWVCGLETIKDAIPFPRTPARFYP